MPRKRTNYKKSAGRRTSSREKSERDFKRVEEEKANDPSWYTVAGQLTKDVASFSFNNPTGIEYQLDTSSTGSFVDPGVMSIYMAPTPGYSEGLSSPINIAAKNFLSFIRKANSGAKNYDSPDVIIYLLAMANAFAYYGWMTRLYGMIRIYTQTNRYLGANLVKCCVVDSDSIQSNLANFRAYINQFALKLSALNAPATMSLFKRYMWMFSNVFTDEGTTKGQMYMYNPAYIYKYDEYNGAGRLVPKPLCLDSSGLSRATPLSFSDIMVFGDDIIGALIGSEDIAIMSGDILKAYGEENIWKLSMIDDNYAILPIFSEEVLLQVHNTVFVGGNVLKDTTLAVGWDSFNVEQDTNIGPGCLICKPLVKFGGNTQGNQILDSWKGPLDPDTAMVASRNIVCGRRWSQGFTALEAFGSEIPIWAKVYTLQANGTMVENNYWGNDSITQFNTSYPTATDALNKISELSYFNEHPRFVLVEYTNTSPYVAKHAETMVGEMSDFTVLSEEDIEKMHLSAILSEFAVPFLGNMVKPAT